MIVLGRSNNDPLCSKPTNLQIAHCSIFILFHNISYQIGVLSDPVLDYWLVSASNIGLEKIAIPSKLSPNSICKKGKLLTSLRPKAKNKLNKYDTLIQNLVNLKKSLRLSPLQFCQERSDFTVEKFCNCFGMQHCHKKRL